MKVLFQFHKGAIKRCLACKISSHLTWFQFHKGAIKRLLVAETAHKKNVSIP